MTIHQAVEAGEIALPQPRCVVPIKVQRCLRYLGYGRGRRKDAPAEAQVSDCDTRRLRRQSGTLRPDIERVQFSPLLMINGRHDFLAPLETHQKPLVRLFPLPEDQKSHDVFEGGHVPPRWQEVARETLDWLDRHLGPVAGPGRGQVPN